MEQRATNRALATRDTERDAAPNGAAPHTLARTVLPNAHDQSRGPVHAARVERSRYETIRPLGSGGMGEVVLMLDRAIGRNVAVKRLLAGADDASVSRFQEEVRTLGRIEHPNVVPVYDAGVDEEGRHFFAMKYVDGESLAEIIERLRAGDQATAREWTLERRIHALLGVLRGLSAAHAQGVLHRDVKPSNVMVSQSGEVVVVDWGVAKSIGGHGTEAGSAPPTASPRTTRSGALVGTPSYMSPEQALGRNERLDERSDLYSAAALFYELLTLEHYLGERNSSAEMLVAVVVDDLSFPRLVERQLGRRALPGELLEFLAKGLEKAPEDRFQSAREMIELLESILAARAALGRPLHAARRRLRGLALLVGARFHLALTSLFANLWPSVTA
jgi:serine/threonine-protein kinase